MDEAGAQPRNAPGLPLAAPEWASSQGLVDHRGEPVSQERLSVLEFVRRTPGCTIRNVADNFQVSHTTAAYHLTALAQRAWISRERHGRAVQHYSSEGEQARARLAPLMHDERSQRLVAHLVERPGHQWTVNALANELGWYHAFLMRTLRSMERHGFVHVKRPGSRYYVQATHRLVHLVQQWPAVL